MAFDWSSMMGKGGGGGGGGGMDMGSMASMASKGADTSNSIYSSLMSPYRMRRQRLIELAPVGLHIGEGIQPVASSRGGSAMAGAMAQERSQGQDIYGVERTSHLDKVIRVQNAKMDTAQSSAAIVRRVAEIIAGGYAGGAGAGAGGGFSAAGAAKGAAKEWMGGLGNGGTEGASESSAVPSLARSARASRYSLGSGLSGYDNFVNGGAY